MVTIKERNYGLDILRVLACYMVIQVHVGELFYIADGGKVAEGDGPFWVGILNSLFRTAVPLFVMITGFLLLPVQEKMGDFFKKRFTRVVIPFLIWCALYAFYNFWVKGEGDISDVFVNILKIPVNFGVEVGHLWYVYMLIGLYLFAPIISPWLQSASQKAIQFYLYIWIFTLAVPYIHLIFPEILGECFWNQTPMLYYFSGFLGYMILAFYIRKFRPVLKVWHCVISILLIIGGYAITVGGLISQIGVAEYVPDLEITWKFESINVGMMTVGLFLILKDVTIPNMFKGITVDISKLSYGMYLVHIMMIDLFNNLLSPMLDSVVLKILLISICSFVASYLVVKLLSYLPKSKYVVG